MESSKFSERFLLNKIDPTWNEFFFTKFGAERLELLLEKLSREWETGPCYPSRENIFRLFRELPLSQIKVVILGQDPYHQPGVADGFAFSTSKPNFIPASLRNILTELQSDLGYGRQVSSGDLTSWVREGVFLLNTSLTVRQSQQLSHAVVWREFTYQLLEYINNYSSKIVWIFWGREAKLLRDKCSLSPDLSITSAHPSPFSAHYGFFGSKPFSSANERLRRVGRTEVNWRPGGNLGKSECTSF